MSSAQVMIPSGVSGDAIEEVEEREGPLLEEGPRPVVQSRSPACRSVPSQYGDATGGQMIAVVVTILLVRWA